MCRIISYTPVSQYLIFGLILILSTTMAADLTTTNLAKMNNDFGLNLFKIVSRDEGNILLSPFSAHVVLSMAYQGAGGQTAQNMAKILQFADPKTTAEEYHKIIGALNRVENVTLAVANKIFVKDHFKIKTEFQDVLVNKYGSEASEIDFSKSQDAAKIINGWVETNTKEKIKDLISAGSLNQDTRLVLVNALYFKGSWAKQFDPELTSKQPFYLLNGEEIAVDMMKLNSKFKYSENVDWNCKILELPYVGGELSMIIFLPNERNGIVQLQQKVQDVNIVEVMQKLQTYSVDVQLPRFKIESTISLTDNLKEMGAGLMFSDEADFSNMADERLKVSEVVQKTFIEVNEEGTTAAAATGVVMMTRCMPMPVRQASFKADHPYVIALLHKSTTTNLLFLGRVTKLN